MSRYDLTPAVEIWVADGPRFSTNNALLYDEGGFANGVTQTVSFSLSQGIVTQTPNGYANPGGAFLPTTDTFYIQFNMISFGAPADTSASLTMDNFQLEVIPEPSAMLLAVAGLGGLALRRRRH